MDEEMMRDLAAIEMGRATVRRTEALQLFYTLSRDFRDAFSDLDWRVATSQNSTKE
jgi:hypothetical protein